MNSKEFVNVIAKEVLESSVDSMQQLLHMPPGRSPSKELIEMSAWYNNLKEIDREKVIKIIKESVTDAVFGFLCVLDGVRAIESENKGELKLYYERGSETVLLNDQPRVNLHELL